MPKPMRDVQRYPTCLAVSSLEVSIVTGAAVTFETFMTHTTIVARVAGKLQEVWNGYRSSIRNIHVYKPCYPW